MQRAHRNHVLATRARQPQPVALHRFHVIRPLVDERDIAAGLGEHAADDGADGAGAEDRNPHS